MQKELAGRPKLWSRYFVTILIMELILAMTMAVMDNILAIYASNVIGSNSYGGSLTTAFTFGAIALAPFVGRMIDSKGRQKIAIIGFAVYSISTALCMVTDVRAVFLTLRVIQGFAKSAAQITVIAMAADIIPKERMGEGLGYDSLGVTIGLSLGPIFGMLLSKNGNYDIVFLSCGLILALAFVLSITMGYERSGRYTIQLQSVSGGRRGIMSFIEPTALPGALVRFIIYIASSTGFVFIALFASSALGRTPLEAGSFFFCLGGGMLVSRLFGRVIDRHDPLVVLIPAFCIMMACQLLLAFGAAHSFFLLLLAGFCFGLEEGLAYPGLRAVAVLDAPEDRKGVVNSMLDFAMDAGIMVGALVFGVIIDAGKAANKYDGFQNMFIISAACALAAAILTGVFYNRKAREKRIAKYKAEAAQ